MKREEWRIAFPRHAHRFALSSLLAASCAPGGEGGRQLVQTHCLFVVGKGRGCLTAGGVRQMLSRGEGCLLAPGTWIDMRAAGRETWVYYQLFFDVLSEARDRPAGAAGEAPPWLGGEARLFHCPALREFIEELLAEREKVEHAGYLQDFQTHNRFHELLYAILEQPGGKSAISGSVEAVQETIQYMHRHYHRKLTVSQLARRARIGRWQYTELFKAITGRSPLDYLTDIRIARAKERLLATDERLRQIAERVGFADEFYFNRRFKQATGLTPGQYRAEKRKRLRVVAFQYLGEMLALGVAPVASEPFLLHLFQPYAAGIAAVDKSAELQHILALEPDLIIHPGVMPQEWTDRLSAAAPTCAVDWKDNVYTRLQTIARLVGREKEAAAWIERYKRQAGLTRERLRAWVGRGETASGFIYYVDGELYVYGPQYLGHSLYHALGFAPPPAVRELIAQYGDFPWMRIAPEAVAEFAGDRVFLIAAGGAENRKRAEEWMNGPEWKDLPAVKRNRAYVLEEKWGYYDPLTLCAILAELERLLSMRRL